MIKLMDKKTFSILHYKIFGLYGPLYSASKYVFTAKQPAVYSLHKHLTNFHFASEFVFLPPTFTLSDVLNLRVT